VLAFALRRAAWALLLCLILSLFTFVIFYVVPRGQQTQQTRGRLADIQRTQQFSGPVFVHYARW
jgi:ABC-type dipeptide/oligopeptide/nickel transport system permease component